MGLAYCTLAHSRLAPEIGLCLALAIGSAASACDLPFGKPMGVHEVGEHANGVAFGDLDGDGVLDLVTTTYESPSEAGEVVVKRGTGGNIFGDERRYPVGEFPGLVCLEDIDGDGDLDIATANESGADVSILINTSDGTFEDEVRYPAGSRPQDLAFGDIDGDGDPDLAVANQGSDTTFVYRNAGDGTFAFVASYPPEDPTDRIDDLPTSVAFGDLDGDGDLDVAIANAGLDEVSLRRNTGDGTFVNETRYATGDFPLAVELADLDDDGDLDMVTANGTSGDVSVFLNPGDGRFGPAMTYAAADELCSLVLGDLDHDGDPDIALAGVERHPYRPNVFVLVNDGRGGFSLLARVGVSTGCRIALGDVDDDEYLDVAVAHWLGFVSVLPNTGDGRFSRDDRYSAGENPWSIASGDLDGDGLLDVVTTHIALDPLSVYRNDGDGRLEPAVRYPLPTGGGLQPALGDLDNDGHLDVAIAGVLVFNAGDGTLESDVLELGGGGAMALGDVDGDGRLDVVETLDAAWVYLNAGDRNFDQAAPYRAGEIPRGVALGDVNGDGHLDIVVAGGSQGDEEIRVLLNAGDGAYPNYVSYPAKAGAFIALGDLDDDGDLDIVTGRSGRSEVSVLLNAGDGTYQIDAEYEVERPVLDLAVGDIDGDGDLDIAAVNSGWSAVSLLLNDGDATFDDRLRYPLGALSRGITLGDFDADGNLDLATTSYWNDDIAVTLDVCPNACRADLDGSGSVGFGDLMTLLASFGECAPACVVALDLTSDGQIDGSDLAALLAVWGPCPRS